MYVAPAYRSRNIGGRLLHTVIQRATALHYERLRLDTLTKLLAASKLYRRTGFYEIAAYNDCPIEEALWFELDLRKPVHGATSAGGLDSTTEAST